jgi:hypothetical protein
MCIWWFYIVYRGCLCKQVGSLLMQIIIYSKYTTKIITLIIINYHKVNMYLVFVGVVIDTQNSVECQHISKR